MDYNLQRAISEEIAKAGDKDTLINEIRAFVHELSGMQHNPVGLVQYVPIEKVFANDYNPNMVARNEMNLLYTSIKHDGYTQPVVTVYEPETDRYVIIDGFHRYSIMRNNKDILEQNNGLLPVVVLKKTMSERMASTIRHNRARGKHHIAGMGNLVFNMLREGVSDEKICHEIGMEPTELVKIKHITGFSKLFEGTTFKPAWVTDKQVKLAEKFRVENGGKGAYQEVN
jgi:ParB-like chromosome segregation protein Spo0J